MSQMDLKDFVSETLIQINHGVQKAREEIQASEGTKVGGRLRELNTQVASEHLANQADGSVAHLVHFDVALTITDTSDSNVGGKLSVASIFSAQGAHSKGASSSEVSRVRFTIPISFEQAPPRQSLQIEWAK